MEGIFVPLSFFLAIFAILYVYWTTRTKERLALINKDLTANIFKNDCSKYVLLKWGLFLVSAGLGVFVAYFLAQVINEVTAYFSMILIFGGIGLMIAYVITNNLAKKD